jgi:hypothetical protein
MSNTERKVRETVETEPEPVFSRRYWFPYYGMGCNAIADITAAYGTPAEQNTIKDGTRGAFMDTD